MVDVFIPFIVLTLIVVIIIQAVERHFTVSHLLAEQSKLIAAVMSKNIGEYTTAVTIEKEKKPRLPQDSDEVDIANADDETYNKFLKEL
jgi:hypothetical protein